MIAPSPLAYVPFVSVENMMGLVHHIGPEALMKELATFIEADFKRWPEFDKTPRVASHSSDGVIELMPTADAENYGFKYVNGHPKNTADGYQTVTAFGVDRKRVVEGKRLELGDRRIFNKQSNHHAASAKAAADGA